MKSEPATVLNEAQILSDLRKFYAGKFGFEFYNQTDSTNLRAIEFFKKGESPFAIVALHQTAGKGRFDRAWHDTSGKTICLTCGFDVRNLPSAVVENFSILAGIYVAKTLSNYAGISLKIKWPNDIYFENKKLAGMIGQCFLDGGKLASMFFGIGVNFGKIEAFECANPISLEECAQTEIEINKTCALVINSIFQAFESLKENPKIDISTMFESFDFLRGKVISVNNFSSIIKGRACGIDAQGRLILETQDFRKITCGAGEATILKDS